MLLGLSKLDTLQEFVVFTMINTVFALIIYITSGSVSALSSFFFVKYTYERFKLK